eukprot:gnl/MRDRNA2_/MRDRNA2_121730_c0_seq1.p1 gnl/MRDRNA2_/MRDRNA2_121730_c0~~gnl/MRDRNA2_/MRDRNA2_121730_c0_seq1.p1  ORF type:complete len:374 (-),score=36.83 gnl/MRDRNA2_/MRDRNA2_121730_c0_seq1:18-1139(-)
MIQDLRFLADMHLHWSRLMKYCPKRIQAILKTGGQLFMETADYETRLRQISTRHLIFETIRRGLTWCLNCHCVVWLLHLAWPCIRFAFLGPVLMLLEFLDGKGIDQEEEAKRRLVDVEVMLLSGEIIAQLTMPSSTTGRELRQEVALRSKTRISAGRVRLLFGEMMLSDDAVVKDLNGEASPKFMLQLIHCEHRNFVPSQSSECNLISKILLIGDSGTGKTNIMDRFAAGTFTDTFVTTIGIDFKTKQVACDAGVVAKLQIWDTAGQERFRTIIQAYCRTSDSFILVYDVSVRESFDHLALWLNYILTHASRDTPICLVGNKTDLTRCVTREEAVEFAANNNLVHFEVSAKTDTSIRAPFHYLTDVLMDRAGL